MNRPERILLDLDQDRLEFLAGGGETGALLRAHDWARSPLGSPPAWPQSLKAALRLCLDSPLPISLWCGPDLVLLYNDAFRAVLGARHPAALGASGRQAWPESWGVLARLLGGAIARGEARSCPDIEIVVESGGVRDKRRFDLSCSPIRDENGGIVGVFCPVTEMSARDAAPSSLREAEARAARLRRGDEHGSRAEASNESEAQLCLIADSLPVLIAYVDRNERYRFTNAAYEDWFGLTREEMSGRRVADVLTPEAYPRLKPHIDRALSGEAVRWEERVPHRDGGTRVIEGNYVPKFAANGAVEGYFALVQDVSDRKRAEEALRDRAEELATILDAVPAAIFIARDTQSRDIASNRAGARLLRLPEGANASKSALSSHSRVQAFRVLDAEGRELAPEELPVQRAARGEPMQDLEEQVVFDDGSPPVFLYGNACPLRSASGEIRGAVAAFVDVTARHDAEAALRRSESRLRFLADAGLVLASSPQGDAALQQIAELSLGDLCDFCYFDLLSEDGRIRRVAWAHCNPEKREQAAQTVHFTPRREQKAHPVVQVLDTGRPVLAAAVDDAWQKRAATSPEHLAFMRAMGFGSIMHVPIAAHGRTMGVMTFCRCRESSHRYAESDLALALDLGLRVGLALEHDRQHQALKESEARFRNMADHAPALIWMTDAESHIVFANRHYETVFGRPFEEVLSEGWETVVHPDDVAAFRASFRDAAAARGRFAADVRVFDAAGAIRWLRCQGAPRAADGAFLGYVGCNVDITDAKAAEAAARESEARLRRSEEELRLVTDAMPALISYVDAERRYRFVNKAYEDWFGRPRDHFVGRPVAEILGRDAYELLRPNIDRVFAGERLAFESMVPYRSGGARHVHVDYIPRMSEDGQVEGYYALVQDIGERKRAEDALRDREERLSAIFSQATVGLAETDVSGRFLAVNDQYCRIVGRSREDLLARRMQDITHPDDLPRNIPLFVRAATEGSPFEIEKRYVRPDGREVWVNNSVFPIRDAEGTIARLTAVCVDVTPRKRAETALRDREQRLSSIFAQASVGFAESDPGGRFTMVNDAYCATVGRSREELLRLAMGDITHPDDWPRNAQLLQELAETGKPFQIEKRIVRPDGSIVWVDKSVAAIRGPDDRVERLLAVIVDVTERKRAEDALRASEAALRAHAEQLEAAMTVGTLGLWRLDFGRETVVLNESYRQLLGLPADRGELSANEALMLIHPDDRERVRDMVRRSRAERTTVDVEYRVLRPDGSTVWLLTRGGFVAAEEGAAGALVGASIDITERKRAEEARLLLIHELNHRVKNTLATVQSIAAQTLRGAEVGRAVRDALEARLLALASAHDVLTNENWEAARLRDVVARAIGPHLGRDGRFRLDGPDLRLSPKTALALAMALHELATNAAKYGALSVPQGRVALTWTVEGAGDERRLRLVWRESGGPLVRPPERRGFGSRLIERGLAAELGGETQIAYEPDGVACTIEAPLALPGGSRS